MKKIQIMAFACLLSAMAMSQSPFTTGNIVVSRIGDGTIPLTSNAHPVFLDEYTPAGVLVRSIALPTSPSGGNKMFALGPIGSNATASLNLSPDGRYLSLIGYNASLGTDEETMAVESERTIARIDYNANVNTTTGISNLDFSYPYSAITNDGNNFWFAAGGSSGLQYTSLGSTTSVQIIDGSFNPTRVSIKNAQLYYSSGSGLILKVGTGLPVTGPQVFTALPGFPIGGGDCQFVFADLNPAIAGDDVLYVANSSTPALKKYSFDGSSWVSNGVIGINTDRYTGITAVITGTTVKLYIVRKITQSSTGSGELVTLTDNTGHNGAFSGTPTVLATAGANMTFRGIAMAPTSPAVSLSTKTFLREAYNAGLGRHKDVTASWATILNTSALNQPYGGAPFNYAGTENVAPGFFASTAGTTDILDWVLVELHDATTPSTIIARKACFIREDGQVVDIDGVSNPTFSGIGANNYYIVIRHRNHLAIRSSSTVFVSGAAPTLYDFTTSQSKAYQNGAFATAAMRDMGSGVFGMWGGNVNMNTNVKYTGPQNDAIAVLGVLGGNQVLILNNTYSSADVNMDGIVKYTGPQNDAIAVLGAVGGNQVVIVNEHQ